MPPGRTTRAGSSGLPLCPIFTHRYLAFLDVLLKPSRNRNELLKATSSPVLRTFLSSHSRNALVSSSWATSSLILSHTTSALLFADMFATLPCHLRPRTWVEGIPR